MSDLNRRHFLMAAAAGAAAAHLTSCQNQQKARRPGPNERLRIAQIGCGGKGLSDMQAVAKNHDIVALCDVDDGKASNAREEHPSANYYHDYRDLLDREKLDAVVISTPDHSHALPALIAMQLGYHVFVQKPLTHTVEEARLLRQAMHKYGVVTSMGNQGTCLDGFRGAAEAIRAGVVGDVTEVHVWTNRPVWPQGIQRPNHIDAIPASFRWDLWLGGAPFRPFAKGRKDTPFSGYCPFHWRGWWDFGTGALGDMACHVANLPFFALELGAPQWVEADAEGATEETAPKASTVRFQFPARGKQPPVQLTWYDGGRLPPADRMPPESQRKDMREPKHGGFLLIGSKGKLYSPTDYGATFRLFDASGATVTPEVAPTLPRSPGIHEEWLDAIFTGTQPMANFDYAAPFTEAMLLGNIALRTPGRVEYDSAAMRITNVAAANELLGKRYTRGFELPQIGA
jgi:predicted dehydrogenase